MHSSEIQATGRSTFVSPQLSKQGLRQRILGLSSGKVMVVGDLLIDELLEGSPERISREAPVLILEHVDTQLIPGGAANTANNIAALGGTCHAVGICGRDEYAGKMAGLFEGAGIAHSLVEDSSRPTTVKTRILSKSLSFRQQLLRLDRISHEPISREIEERILEKIKTAARGHQAIILSDYKGGLITEAVIKTCKAVAAELKIKLVVDAQSKFERFHGVTLMTPNQPDTEQMVGFQINSRDALRKAGEMLLNMTGAEAMLITRGAHGMALFQPGLEMCELPVFNKSEVFDVSGAGDTVIATMTLALVSGASFVEAMALGNLAAGIVVKKPGTATTTQAEMLETLDSIAIS